MDQQLLENTMNELAARDRYMLTSMQSGMTVRELYHDLPEAEVVTAMWGEHAPPDVAAMLVMEVGDSVRTIAIPLSTAEEAKWHAAAATMWSALSAEDDATSAE